LQNKDLSVETSAAFTDAALDPKFAPISWTLGASSNVGATIEKIGKTRGLQVFALSGASGRAAFKYLFIPPGTYHFGTAQTINTPVENASASWVLRCVSAANEVVIFQYDIIRSARAAAPSFRVNIPLNCPFQRLELNLTGGDSSSGLELLVERVEIGT
jgi:hypothetical protein